jgi:hypothetical protein
MKRPIDPRRIEVVPHAVADELRKLQPYERVAMVAQAFEMVWEAIRARVASENPAWSAEQVHGEVVRIISSGAVPFDARPAIRDGKLVMVLMEVEPEIPMPPPMRRPGLCSTSE